jgi:hypothetical protein
LSSQLNWACTHCGRPAGRKDIVKRHVRLVHKGIGTVVSFTEYIIGRLSGYYTPSAPPILAKSGVNKEKLSAEAKGRTRVTTPFDMFQESFCRESGVQLARKAFDPLSFMQWKKQGQFYQSVQPIINQVSPSKQPCFTNLEEIFGLELFVCNKCSTTKAYIICFSKDTKELKQIRIVPTSCPPNSMMANSDCVSDKAAFKRSSSERFPSVLKKFVRDMTDNTDNIQLIAIKVPDVNPLSPSNCVKLLIESLEETRSNQVSSIALPYSEDKCLDLQIPKNKEHYIARALKDKRTTLNDGEMLNFFQKSAPSTFAFFKVKIPETGISEIYLMGIIIAMNVNNKNNNRLTLSLANQIDHKTVLDSQDQSQEQLPPTYQQAQDSRKFSDTSRDLFKKSSSPISKAHEILGYRSYVCEKCLVPVGPSVIYKERYHYDQKNDALHECTSETLSSVRKLAFNDVEYKVKQLEYLREKQLNVVKEKVKEWTKNQPYILSIQSATPLKNSSQVNAADLQSAARRATKDYLTALSDDELTDFLRQSKGSTCMNIKMDINVRKVLLPSQISGHDNDKSSTHTSPLVRYYRMTILPFDLVSSYTKEISLLSYVCDNWCTHNTGPSSTSRLQVK